MSGKQDKKMRKAVKKIVRQQKDLMASDFEKQKYHLRNAILSEFCNRSLWNRIKLMISLLFKKL